MLTSVSALNRSPQLQSLLLDIVNHFIQNVLCIRYIIMSHPAHINDIMNA